MHIQYLLTSLLCLLSVCLLLTELRELRGAIQKDLKLYPSLAACSPGSSHTLQSKDSKHLRLVLFSTYKPKKRLYGTFVVDDNEDFYLFIYFFELAGKSLLPRAASEFYSEQEAFSHG